MYGETEPLYVCEDVARYITYPLESNDLTAEESSAVEAYLESIAIDNQSALLVEDDYYWMSDNGICEITGREGVVFSLEFELMPCRRYE